MLKIVKPSPTFVHRSYWRKGTDDSIFCLRSRGAFFTYQKFNKKFRKIKIEIKESNYNSSMTFVEKGARAFSPTESVCILARRGKLYSNILLVRKGWPQITTIIIIIASDNNLCNLLRKAVKLHVQLEIIEIIKIIENHNQYLSTTKAN